MYARTMLIIYWYDFHGNPLVEESEIQKEIDLGIPKEMVQQEYYCDWHSANVGAIYSQNLDKMRADGRLTDFQIDKRSLVYTFWDIGISDATAIWFAQQRNQQIYLINYYENNNEGFGHYLDYINNYAKETGIRYGGHYGPHDLGQREYMSGKSRIAQAMMEGIHFKLAPKIGIADGINAARLLFNFFHIHKTNCSYAVKCLQQYHRQKDEKNNVYKNEPVHDWSSHCADALRYLAVVWRNDVMTPQHHQLEQWYSYR